MADFTPGRLSVVPWLGRWAVWDESAPKGRKILAQCDGPRTDAETIVRACNAHDALVEALAATTKDLEHWLAWKNGEAMQPQREKGEEAVRIARQALEAVP